MEASPPRGVVYHRGPRKDAVHISDGERTRSTKNNGEMDRVYEKQPTLVDCQANCHSAPVQGLSLGLIMALWAPETEVTISPNPSSINFISALSHKIISLNSSNNVQRGTKRYVNLAKQDPGKARQSG